MYENCYIVQTQTFCTQQEDDKRSMNSTPIIVHQTTLTSSNALDANHLYIYKPHESLKTVNIVINTIFRNERKQTWVVWKEGSDTYNYSLKLVW
ncbi:hypothetical protein TSAR_012313 [Trichomalopsis sarcophagae]|uniref:Uncharacterized protein n=1 Tax=Trichomalopsis sarcophagae TaxID=543379 RepID=A0A232ELQ9_9HYME|nr:hypothetical protein TSAR_012313 [Trichomalopsis sarcophagae]